MCSRSAKFFSLQHSFSCILDVPPFVCASSSPTVFAPQSWCMGQYTWRTYLLWQYHYDVEWWRITHHNLGDQGASCPCGTFGTSMGLCSFIPRRTPLYTPPMYTPEDLESRPLSTMYTFCTGPYTALCVVTPGQSLALQAAPPHCSWSLSVAMLLKYIGFE